MDELKPCPFCGAKARMKREKYFGCISYSIECTNDVGNCIVPSSISFETAEKAVEAWNRMAKREHPEKPKQVEKYDEEVNGTADG